MRSFSLFRPPASSIVFLRSLSLFPKSSHLPFLYLSSSSMSSNRTVADALMGAARRAAQKKSKTLETSTSTTTNNDNNKCSSSSSPSKKPKTLESTTPTPTPSDNNNNGNKCSFSSSPSKKPKTLETTEELTRNEKPKDLAVELKRKGADFKPKAVATWKDGDRVPFLFLARALDLIAEESGRIVSTEILSNVFRTVIATTPEDLLATVYLSANRVAPPHEGLELGIGEASLVKALAEAYGRTEEYVKKKSKVM